MATEDDKLDPNVLSSRYGGGPHGLGDPDDNSKISASFGCWGFPDMRPYGSMEMVDKI